MDLTQIAEVLFHSLDIDSFCLLFQTHNRELNKLLVLNADPIFNTKKIGELRQLPCRKGFLKFYMVDTNGRKMNIEHIFQFERLDYWSNFQLFSAWDNFSRRLEKFPYMLVSKWYDKEGERYFCHPTEHYKNCHNKTCKCWHCLARTDLLLRLENGRLVWGLY